MSALNLFSFPVKDVLDIELAPAENGKPSRWVAKWRPVAQQWFQSAFIPIFDAQNSGGTNPGETLYVGKSFFNTTYGIPQWWNGSTWIDATGGTGPMFLRGDGAPTDAVTGANVMDKGTVYVDSTNADWYMNAGTLASPVWKIIVRAG